MFHVPSGRWLLREFREMDRTNSGRWVITTSQWLFHCFLCSVVFQWLIWDDGWYGSMQRPWPTDLSKYFRWVECYMYEYSHCVTGIWCGQNRINRLHSLWEALPFYCKCEGGKYHSTKWCWNEIHISDQIGDRFYNYSTNKQSINFAEMKQFLQDEQKVRWTLLKANMILLLGSSSFWLALCCQCG